MIKIVGAHIEEIRGIRKLDIKLGQATFAVSGPNGSGKSGVIDAIEFALTGQIGRLTGPGTKDLSVGEHGPHVDKAKFPDAAFVTLEAPAKPRGLHLFSGPDLGILPSRAIVQWKVLNIALCQTCEVSINSGGKNFHKVTEH